MPAVCPSTLTGRIFNIQPYSVHDGPGIRNVVFMKGCPLHCLWCSNPESQSPAVQIGYQAGKCIGCTDCVKVCAVQALRRAEDGHIIRDEKRCTRCFRCVAVCCSQAMHTFGEDCTVEAVYRRTQPAGSWRSNGGVTISGGEPLAQAEFVTALLARYQRVGTHTAIETTAYAPWETLAGVAAHCDLVLCDMKFFDAGKHKTYTGVDNTLIKNNLRRLKTAFPAVRLVVRTPVIPGINDDEQELRDIAAFLKHVPGLDGYELLPFHAYAAPKYAQLDREYAVADLKAQDKDVLAALNARLCAEAGLPSLAHP